MEITSKINDTTYLIEIAGAIVGTYAQKLNRFVHSINFVRLGIKNIVFNFAQTTMIDSIGLEAIDNAHKQGLRVSILNSQGVVNDMLERAGMNAQLSHFVQIEKENHIQILAQNECPQEIIENITVTSDK
jgi:anti-anti-sigma factor